MTLRDEMWAGGIEAATRRQIFQDEFKPWIDAILAQVPGGEGQLTGLFHVIVPVDKDNVPAEAPDHTKTTHGGALAIIDERAVLGWTSGMFRKKPHSYAIARAPTSTTPSASRSATTRRSTSPRRPARSGRSRCSRRSAAS